jgi:hypothetical protein
MPNVFWDALVESAKMIPLLLIIYIGIEYIENKFGGNIRDGVKNAGKAGPVLGAIFGIIPQCGFSVISTALYTNRLISVGTLLAVYLSTSDEAIPIIIAQPDKIGMVLPLLAAKLVIAVFAGYIVDLVVKTSDADKTAGEICAGIDKEDVGCCGHTCGAKKPDLKKIIIHPFIHTLKIFVFIFSVSLIINFIVFKTGPAGLSRLFLGHSLLQPAAVGLIGLIPNCAASVAITQVFIKGGITFGAAVSGLCASAGLGILVLLKENKNFAENMKIIGMLYGISVFAGMIIQLIQGTIS